MHLFAVDYASSDGLNTGLLIIRVVVGLTVSAHGLNKFFGGGKIPGTARWFDSMGMKPNGTIHALMAATTETVAGFLLALGFLTPLAAAGISGVMVVAAWTANRKNGFFIVNHGWEYNLVLAAVAIGIATGGPGLYSLDDKLGMDWAFTPKLDLPIALAGVLAGVLLIVCCYRPPAEADG